ncbi:MAG: ABC transporter permease [Erysipelotrichaceae bacterium]|nr:ABC transporter permease [Erysipelotrichaceae bacterium]
MKKIKEFFKNLPMYLKSFFIALGGWFKFFFKTIYANKKAFIGLIILAIFLFLTIFGRLIFPYDNATNFSEMYLSPSPEHWLGTDGLGRDLFKMIVYGTKDVMEIAFYTAILTVGLGCIIGISSGYFGGWYDRIISLIINLFMSLPTFPILLIMSMFLTIRDNFTLALLLAIFAWPGLARAIRSQIISLKERDFIQICSVMGLSKAHIAFKELLPNIFSYVAISFISSMRNGITASVGMMTLGLALYEPTNWGGIIINARNSGALSIPAARMCIIAPILAIMIFQIGSILFSNGLDELVNPRLRGN